jgi:hypothetical protein
MHTVYHIGRKWCKTVEAGSTKGARGMPGINEDDIVWIQDAVKEYERSRKWLDEQIRERRLSVVQKPGINKIYLLRAELDALTSPQIVQPREDKAAG